MAQIYGTVRGTVYATVYVGAVVAAPIPERIELSGRWAALVLQGGVPAAVQLEAVMGPIRLQGWWDAPPQEGDPMTVRSDVKWSDGYFRGEDKELAWTVKNAAGEAVDVTSWTLKLHLKDANGTSLGDPLAVTGGNGEASIKVPRASTLNLKRGTYAYELWREDEGFYGVPAFGSLPLW